MVLSISDFFKNRISSLGLKIGRKINRKIVIRNEALITSETFEPNLTGFKNLSGLVSGIIEFLFLSL